MDWASSCELGLVELGAGLEGVALDVIEGDLEGLSGWFGTAVMCAGRWRWRARREEGFEALSQGAAFWIVCGGRHVL